MTKSTARPAAPATLLLLLLLLAPAAASAQRPELPDAAETQAALRRLSVTAGVLYVGAHPDDENTALLAYLARGRGARTAYLSLTRGDGGQNLLGPEKGELLGVVRTQELLAARRLDGARGAHGLPLGDARRRRPEPDRDRAGRDARARAHAGAAGRAPR